MKYIKLYEQFVNEAAIYDNETIDVYEAIELLNDALSKADPGCYSVNKSVLDDQINILVSFQPAEKVTGQCSTSTSSNKFEMIIFKDGKIEVFKQYLHEPGTKLSAENLITNIKFKKTTAKSMKDAADKLVKYVNEIQKRIK